MLIKITILNIIHSIVNRFMFPISEISQTYDSKILIRNQKA